MDFNLDDPLADLISDNSNDSFFETAIRQKKTINKSHDGANSKNLDNKKMSATNKMQDLFGIQSSSAANKVLTDSNFISNPPKIINIPKPTTVKNDRNKIIDNNDEDIITDLGFDPKKPKATKLNLFDDLLSSIDNSKNSQLNTRVNRPVTASGGSKNISRQSTETTEYSGIATPQGTFLPTARPKTSVGRRQSINSNNDPLGLFTTPITDSTKDQFGESKQDSIQELGIRGKTKTLQPDWLGINTGISKPKPKELLEEKILQTTNDQISSNKVNTPFPNNDISSNSTNHTFPSQNAIAAVHFENQNTLQALNQQESQIKMVSQLKIQEAALMEMQKKQQQLINQQENKFNELLQNQIARQNNLEMIIKSQQERINSHIEMMMLQPPLALSNMENQTTDTNIQSSSNVGKNVNTENYINLENEVKRLELEKLRLEDLISNINENHEKEIEFTNKSHKKQIELLVQNLESVQKRLQSEISSIEEFFGKKLQDLELDKKNIIEQNEKNINNIKENHSKIISELKQEYEASIRNIKDDHKSILESIRESKLMEFAIVQDNSSYVQILRNASSNLDNATGNLQTIRDELYEKIDYEYKQREGVILSREKQLNNLERRLKLAEEASEREKERLLELVTSLELQLQKLSKDSADEQWNFRQKQAMIEVERSAFEREKEYFREQMLRDEKKLEQSKQSQIEEYQRLMHMIQDEKHLLAIEISKFETKKLLEQNSDPTISKSEIDAALKIAKDATKQADNERERFLNLQRELEVRKRNLIDEENELRSKTEELESEIIKVKLKEQKIQDAIKRQSYLEQSLNAKIQFVQNQTKVLAERENKISEERLLLSKERMNLQEYKSKIELNKCSLCKIGERNAAISNILTGNDVIPDMENYKFSNDTYTSNNDDVFRNLNNANHNIDQLFDKDIEESIRKIENLNKTIEFHDSDKNFLNDQDTEFFRDGQSQSMFMDPEFATIEFAAKVKP